jgi:hypothetical protein
MDFTIQCWTIQIIVLTKPPWAFIIAERQPHGKPWWSAVELSDPAIGLVAVGGVRNSARLGIQLECAAWLNSKGNHDRHILDKLGFLSFPTSYWSFLIGVLGRQFYWLVDLESKYATTERSKVLP